MLRNMVSNQIAEIIVEISIKPFLSIILQKNWGLALLNLSNDYSMEVKWRVIVTKQII